MDPWLYLSKIPVLLSSSPRKISKDVPHPKCWKLRCNHSMAIVPDLFFHEKSQLAKDVLQLTAHYIPSKRKFSSWIQNLRQKKVRHLTFRGIVIDFDLEIITRFFKINAILEGFPNRKRNNNFWRCFSEVVLTLFIADPTDAGETLNSGARTKGVLEPRLSGLGLRENCCFLGMVSNHEMETYQDTHPKYHELLPYYPSVSQRSKMETRQFVICGSFSSWTWGTPIAMWVYKKTNDIMFVPHVWTSWVVFRKALPRMWAFPTCQCVMLQLPQWIGL